MTRNEVDTLRTEMLRELRRLVLDPRLSLADLRTLEATAPAVIAQAVDDAVKIVRREIARRERSERHGVA